jgi:hypothetical protein
MSRAPLFARQTKRRCSRLGALHEPRAIHLALRAAMSAENRRRNTTCMIVSAAERAVAKSALLE